MKKLSYILLLTCWFLTSCKDFLEVKQDNVITDETAIQTKDDLQSLLTSCYDAARSNTYFGGSMIFLSDFMADDIAGDGYNGDWGAFYGHRTSLFIPACGEIWQDPYLTIYRCNMLERFINEKTFADFSQAEKDRMIGECRFLRAVGHFEMVLRFGQPIGPNNGGKDAEPQSGVPIRLIADQSKIVRATTLEVYAQVLADLDEAITKLPESNGSYADKWAAKAMKAKVLFQMGAAKQAECLTLLEDIIANSGKKLNSNLTKRYAVPNDTANHEVVFGLLTKKNDLARIIDVYKKRPTADILLSQSLYNEMLIESSDIRDSLWIDAAKVQSNKFKYLGSSRECVLPIIHLTELTLMRAETNALLGNGDAALVDLNKIRTRANLLPYTSTLQSALLAEIRHQRRIEMFGEGNRLFDLKRIGANYQADLVIRNSPWNCAGMIVQIPNAESAGNLDIQLNAQGGCQ